MLLPEAPSHGRARLHAHDERILVSLFRGDYRRKRRAALARALQIVGERRAALQRLTAHLLQFRGRSIGATMLVIDDESYQPSDLLTATRRQVSSLFAPLWPSLLLRLLMRRSGRSSTRSARSSRAPACVEINQCVDFCDNAAPLAESESAVRDPHRHAIEQTSRRWRGG